MGCWREWVMMVVGVWFCLACVRARSCSRISLVFLAISPISSCIFFPSVVHLPHRLLTRSVLHSRKLLLIHSLLSLYRKKAITCITKQLYNINPSVVSDLFPSTNLSHPRKFSAPGTQQLYGVSLRPRRLCVVRIRDLLDLLHRNIHPRARLPRLLGVMHATERVRRMPGRARLGHRRPELDVVRVALPTHRRVSTL